MKNTRHPLRGSWESTAFAWGLPDQIATRSSVVTIPVVHTHLEEAPMESMNDGSFTNHSMQTSRNSLRRG